MILVTCAIIRNDDEEILLVQRGEATDHPLKWEFPGGKLIDGESEEECIIREVVEELSMDIVIREKLAPVDHDYGQKQIRLIPFICDTLDELPFLSEHVAYKWVKTLELMSFDFSEADIYVAQNYLEKMKMENKEEGMVIPELNENAGLQEVISNLMSSREAGWIALSALDNAAMFRKLYEYSFSPDKKLSLRASWTLTKVCDQDPEIIYPYLNQLVEALEEVINESALRSLLRILSLSDLQKINKSNQGRLADFCFALLSSGFAAIAVKAYSMEILYKLTVIFPELANELAGSIRILMEDGSAGITSRGRQILGKLANLRIKPEN